MIFYVLKKIFPRNFILGFSTLLGMFPKCWVRVSKVLETCLSPNILHTAHIMNTFFFTGKQNTSNHKNLYMLLCFMQNSSHNEPGLQRGLAHQGHHSVQSHLWLGERAVNTFEEAKQKYGGKHYEISFHNIWIDVLRISICS